MRKLNLNPRNEIKKIKRPKIDTPWLKYYNTSQKHLKYHQGSIYDYLEKQSLKYLDLIAYEYFSTKRTYQEFLDKIEETAKALKIQGVKKGDAVTICMPNTPEGIIMFYAINKIGAVANMVHPLSSEKELEFFLNVSNSSLVLTVDIMCEKVLTIIDNTKVNKIIVASVSDDMKKLTKLVYWLSKGRKIKYNHNHVKLVSWPDFINLGSDYGLKTYMPRKGSDEAVILYSGGTSGKQKGIVLTNLNFNALALQSHLMCDPSKEGDSVLAVMPIFHGFGIGVCIHTPLCAGMKCILVPQIGKNLPNLIKHHKPNFIAGVPTLFEALLKSKKFKKNDLECVTCVVCGGDLLTAELKTKIDVFLYCHGSNAEIRVGYGLTECTGASCLTPTMGYKDGSIGIPFPDVLYKIVRIGTHERADYNEDGEICISGPTIMREYLDDIKETVQTLRKHNDNKLWLHTGDIGCMDEDGFIYFKSRLKRIIISSGYNIYPSYIENVINSHPAVLTSIVIGIPHPYKVQVAKAFIVLKDGYEADSEIKNSIKELCKTNIAKYSLPYEYEYRKTLPKTLVGKVAYTELENK